MSPSRPRIILDTGIYISRLLRPASVPAQVVLHAFKTGVVLASNETIEEFLRVVTRSKFSLFIDPTKATEFASVLYQTCELVDVSVQVAACRDPSDNKFLALALVGKADMIVTGDADLLVLLKFQGVSILSPRQYLDANV